LNLRQIALVGLAALALGGTAVAQQVAQTGPSSPTTPPPPPPPNGSVATPGTLIGAPSPAASSRPPTLAPSPAASASAAPRGRGRGRGPASPEPSASETPEPPQFSTMDGVWEVQLQPLTGTGRAIYSHFYLTQKGDALTGTWVRSNSDKLQLAGTFDGRLFKLTATDVKKNANTLSGYAENFSDMVGLMTTTDPKDKGTPFTAAHRKKERPGG
jgi:hypothetical protein